MAWMKDTALLAVGVPVTFILMSVVFGVIGNVFGLLWEHGVPVVLLLALWVGLWLVVGARN